MQHLPALHDLICVRFRVMLLLIFHTGRHLSQTACTLARVRPRPTMAGYLNRLATNPQRQPNRYHCHGHERIHQSLMNSSTSPLRQPRWHLASRNGISWTNRSQAWTDSSLFLTRHLRNRGRVEIAFSQPKGASCMYCRARSASTTHSS